MVAAESRRVEDLSNTVHIEVNGIPRSLLTEYGFVADGRDPVGGSARTRLAPSGADRHPGHGQFGNGRPSLDIWCQIRLASNPWLSPMSIVR